jgi:hypothetical protein
MKPPAVSRLNDEADDMIRQIAGAAVTPPTTPDTAPDDPSDDGALQPDEAPALPAAPQVVQSGPLPGFEQEGEDDPDAPPDDGGAPDPTELTRVQHAYKVLQGKLRAEDERHRETKAANAALRELVASFQTRLASLEEEAREPRAAPAPAAPPAAPINPVTDREREEFGEVLEVASRAAAHMMDARLKVIEQTLDKLSGRVETAETRATSAQRTTQQSARERMLGKLTEEVSDWKTLNNDPEFLNWLAEEDDFAGEPRKALLDRAYNKNDAMRVVKFFTAYKEHAGYSTGNEQVAEPGSAPPNRPNGTGGVRKPVIDPATLVAPGRGRSAPRNGTAQQITWTPATIAQFYKDMTAGLYKNKQDEADRLERDIFTAQTEGRVLPQ